LFFSASCRGWLLEELTFLQIRTLERENSKSSALLLPQHSGLMNEAYSKAVAKTSELERNEEFVCFFFFASHH